MQVGMMNKADRSVEITALSKAFCIDFKKYCYKK